MGHEHGLAVVPMKAERARLGGIPSTALIMVALIVFNACRVRNGGLAETSPLVVYSAGTLARPLQLVIDSFSVREHIQVQVEDAGSVETARKLTALHKIPDVIALADEDVCPRLLLPSQVHWYVQFARNRMVLAYTDQSRYAGAIGPQSSWRILQHSGIEVGRSDPALDPNGYRTLLTVQLAERWYGRPDSRGACWRPLLPGTSVRSPLTSSHWITSGPTNRSPKRRVFTMFVSPLRSTSAHRRSLSHTRLLLSGGLEGALVMR